MINQKKVKAGFLIFSLQGGGAERNVLNIVRYVQKNTIEPYIITIKDRNDYRGEYRNESKYVTSLLPDKPIPKLLRPIKFLSIFSRFVQFVRQHNIDVLIAAGEYIPFYIVAAVSFIMKKKSILIVGNNIIAEELSRPFLRRYFEHLLFASSMKRANAVICVSHGLSKEIINYYGVAPHKVHVIQNGVEKQRIIQQAKRPLPPQYKDLFCTYNIITSMGRLELQKGFDHLLKAFYLTKKKIPSLKLIIIGQGKLDQRLHTLIQSLHLQSDVLLTGFLESDKYSLIKESDLFVLASRYEGLGNAIIEALTLSTPVVCTDCPYGPKELLSESRDLYEKTIRYPYLGSYGILSEPRPEDAPFQTEIDRFDHSLSKSIIMMLNQSKTSFKTHPPYRNNVQEMVNNYGRIIATI